MNNSALCRWLFLLVLPWAWLAAAEEAVPPLSARVTDLTGTLAPQETAALEQRLKTFEEKKGSQIAVLIVPTTGQESIEQYGIRVAEQWRLGRGGVDDGALLLVAKQDRTVRIEVGYGLEGVLNDATARRIIAESIVPRFQAGDFNGGIVAGVERMMAVIEGEALPAPKRPARSAGDIGEQLPVIFVAVLFAGGLLRALLGRFLGSAATGGVAASLVWLMAGTLAAAVLVGMAVFLFNLLGGVGRGLSLGRRGGVWGGGFGSSSGRGGFSGGGGGFGGGGASGRW